MPIVSFSYIEFTLNYAYYYACRFLIINFAKIFPMKQILLLIMACMFSVCGYTQTEWERFDLDANVNDGINSEKTDIAGKYLAGAVPLVDGKVEWVLDVDAPGKTAGQIYDIILKCFTGLTKTGNQLEGSHVSLTDEDNHVVVADIREWLVFGDKLFDFDRTKFFYTLIAYCEDGHLEMSMGRISYRYEEARVRGGYFYKAEDWITDNHALNRKKTKLLRGAGKFRRKTIDRKDFIFSTLKDAILR